MAAHEAQASLARSDGATDTYRYDGAGRLVELASRGNAARYAYDADGNVVEEALPGGSRRMQWTDGQLSGYQQDGSPYQNGASIKRDAAGRRLSETRAGVTTSYAYDEGGQLVSHGRTRLTYDDTGRRTSVTDGPRRTDYQYDAAGQLLATSAGTAQTTYAYDAAGRRTHRQDARGTAVTEYDAWGQPARSVTRTANGTTTELRLTHDADGQLVAVTENGRTTNIEWDSEREIPQPTRIVRPDGRTVDLVHGATRAFALVDGTKVVAQATDSLGSTLRNGGTGALAAAQSYDAFGDPGDPGDSGQGGETVQLGYRGELTVGGLVHLRARDYDPTTGSLTTPDPLDTEPGETSVPSPYVYALSDPLNRIDPLGLSAVDDRAFGRVRTAPNVGVAPAVPVVVIGGGVVSLPAVLTALAAAVAAALLYRFGKKVFQITIEYRGTYSRTERKKVPKVGGVYFMTLKRSRAYVGQSNNIKTRFYAHLRKFNHNHSDDIRSISVFHVAVSPGFDAPFRSVAECALHRNLTRQGVNVVNDTRFIPGC